jgi:hypothetical protein
MLLRLTEGESISVDGVEWHCIGDKFAVPSDALGIPDADGDARVFVHRGDLDDYFEATSMFEVVGA